MHSPSPVVLSCLLAGIMFVITGTVAHFLVKKSPTTHSQETQQREEGVSRCDESSHTCVLTRFSFRRKWPPYERVFALLIGIDRYHHRKNLSGAARDANAVEAFLSQFLSVP